MEFLKHTSVIGQAGQMLVRTWMIKQASSYRLKRVHLTFTKCTVLRGHLCK